MPTRRLDRSERQFRLPFEEVAGALPPQSPAVDPPRAPTAAPPPVTGSIPPDPPDPQPPPHIVLRYVRNPRARRYIVRVRPDGIVRVTIPRGGSEAAAASFVHRHRAWVDDQLDKLRRAAHTATAPLRAGDRVLVRGVPMPVTVEAAHHGRVKVRIADAPAGLTAPGGDLRPVAIAMLRALAQRELPGRLLALAAEHGLTVTRVTIRNQRSRWGSCSTSGSISLNWRLVQMPPEVRDYVLVHELMHLREANHSRRFWRHVARACPWHVEARRWLDREGKTLL
jgi:hypothetical protein